MRVTRNMLANNIIQNLNRSGSLITRYQNEIASGKRINAVSDDPVGAARALRLRAVLAQNQEYLANSNEGIAWLDQTEVALSEITEILNEARELAIYGAGGTLPADSLNALAQQAGQMISHLIQVGNSTYGDRFIFAGQNTAVRPLTADELTGAVYHGDAGAVPLEISWGSALPINVSGQEVFTGSGVFGALTALQENLKSGNLTELSGNVLALVNAATEKILSLRAETGAKMGRLELNLNRLGDNNISLEKLLSQTEDADIPALTIGLSLKQAAYQATLMVGAKIIQPTLVDFLR